MGGLTPRGLGTKEVRGSWPQKSDCPAFVALSQTPLCVWWEFCGLIGHTLQLVWLRMMSVPALLSGSGSPGPAQPSESRGRGGCWPQSRKVGQWRRPGCPGDHWRWPVPKELFTQKDSRPCLCHFCHSYILLGYISRDQQPQHFSGHLLQHRLGTLKILQGHEGNKFSLHVPCNKIRSCEVWVTISLGKIFLIALNSLLLRKSST